MSHINHLIEEHHSQVQLALNHFEQVEQDYALEREDPTALGVKAQRVKKYLAELAKLPMATEKQLDHIKKLVALIEIGRYTSLPTAIDKLIKSKAQPTQALIGIDKIAAEYNVKDNEVNKTSFAKSGKPQLILSESFK